MRKYAAVSLRQYEYTEMQICDVRLHDASEFFTEEGFDPDAVAVYLYELQQVKGWDDEHFEIHAIHICRLALQGKEQHRERKTLKYLESLV